MSSVLLPIGYNHVMSVEGASFGDWLVEQLERRDLSQADLARLGKLTNADVSRWINNKRIPSSQSCLRIAEVLQLNEDIVLRAAGHKRPLNTPQRPRSLDDILKELEAERPIAVPVVEQIASAGRGEAAVGYVYLPPMGRKRPRLFAMKVKGNCMADRINDGDTIIVDPEDVPLVGKIVVAVVGDDFENVLVKYLDEKQGQYWLRPLHGELTRVDANVHIVGVVWKIISDA